MQRIRYFLKFGKKIFHLGDIVLPPLTDLDVESKCAWIRAKFSLKPVSCRQVKELMPYMVVLGIFLAAKELDSTLQNLASSEPGLSTNYEAGLVKSRCTKLVKGEDTYVDNSWCGPFLISIGVVGFRYAPIIPRATHIYLSTEIVSGPSDSCSSSECFCIYLNKNNLYTQFTQLGIIDSAKLVNAIMNKQNYWI